jgi:hypothetical protein
MRAVRSFDHVPVSLNMVSSSVSIVTGPGGAMYESSSIAIACELFMREATLRGCCATRAIARVAMRRPIVVAIVWWCPVSKLLNRVVSARSSRWWGNSSTEKDGAHALTHEGETQPWRRPAQPMGPRPETCSTSTTLLQALIKSPIYAGMETKAW